MKLLRILLILVILPFNLLLAKNISFYAHQEKNSVYYGQNYNAVLILESDGEISPTPVPKINQDEPTNDYTIQVAERPRVSRSFYSQTINGRTTEKSTYTYVWDIVITPTSTNNIGVIDFKIKADGKSNKAKLRPITVIPPKPSPYAQIELSVDKTDVIVEDTFRITASIKLAAVEYNGRKNPPLHQRAIPQLILPHLDKQYEEITVIGKGANELVDYASSNIGMYINNYSISSPYDIIPDNSKSIFNLPNSITTENGTNFYTYSWTTFYKAQKPSSITFDPITLIGQIQIPEFNNRTQLTDIYIVSNPIEITISEPPLEGRPESFIGAISDKFKVHTSLDTLSCKEGDPINLTLTIENVENPLSIVPPNLMKISEFSKKFRVSGEAKATPTEAEKKVTFEYSIRPLVSGTIEIPSIELGYYNVNSNKYLTKTTTPIPVRVDPAPQIENVEEVFAQEEDDTTSEITQYYPTAISQDSATIASTTANNTIIKLAILAPFIWLSSVFFKLLFKHRKQIVSRIRNISIEENAIKALNNAKTPQEIMNAVTSFIKQKFKQKTSSFTPNEIIKLLEEHNVATEIVNELSITLNRIFNLSFAPDANIPKEVNDAKKKIIPCLRKLKGWNKTLPQILFALLSAIVVICIIILPVYLGLQLATSYKEEQKPAIQTEFEIREANLMFYDAITQDNFSNVAANYYAKLSFEQGSHQPAILHNYATALILAGYTQEAINLLEYIEILTGTTTELNNSMLFALQEKAKLVSTDTQDSEITEEPTLDWYRVPLFWHYNFSIYQRANALCFVWIAIWFVLLLRLFIQKHKAINLCLIIFSFIFILTFSSYIISHGRLNEPIPNIMPDDFLLEQESSNEEAN